ncbi:hypothetical protein AADG42_15575 [Ammonicoccus fulvus]|uniref:DUF418 domain-containing protein n=1 Tax=Ammonicoccus fulvus TaxID=3138240 RepID=A0ABZ3FU99_9ACTN
MRLAVIGAVAAVLASAGSWYLLERRGGLAALTGAATEVMSREDFTDTLVWGAEGTLPTNSPWWLAVLAPHTTTPFDLVFTLGIALAVLGVTLTLALVAPRFLRPVAIFGSLPLTLYALHLLLLAAPWLPETGWPAFGLHVVVLAVFALVWRHFFPRGPLEQVLWWSAHAVEDRIAPRRRIR